MKYNSKFKNIISGFTLLEALMAVSILMVAVVAPITVSQKGLSSAVYAKSQMIASYLAQDAIEYIKNVRDQTAIQNNFEWGDLSIFGDTNTKTLCKSAAGCKIDTITGVISPYVNTDYLSINPDYFYGYAAGGTPTNFTRQIKIDIDTTKKDINDRYYKALVTVTVGWGNNNDKVVVKTLIFNY